MRVLALDPGGSTGWAAFLDEEKVAGGTIYGGLEGFRSWASLTTRLEFCTHLVVEDFVVEPGFVGRPVASEIIGMARAMCPRPMHRQLRSQKATLIKGTEVERFAWLREHGFSGEGHELDADTHALIFLRRMGHLPTIQKYWPQDG